MPGPDQNRYPGIGGISDPQLRRTIKLLMDRVNFLEGQMATVQQQRALTGTLNAANQQVSTLADPTADQDAVNVRSMKKYVEAAIYRNSHPVPDRSGRGATDEGQTPPDIADHTAVVVQARADYVSGGGLFDTPESILQIAIAVCQALVGADPDAGNPGLLQKTSGENIAPYGNTFVSFPRVCYPSGVVFKILVAAGIAGDPGVTNTAAWNFDDRVDPGRYVPVV